MVDATIDLSDKKHSPLLTSTILYDILGSKHKVNSPNKYTRGKKKIDYMFGSMRVVQLTKF